MPITVSQKIVTWISAALLAAALSTANAAPVAQQEQNTSQANPAAQPTPATDSQNATAGSDQKPPNQPVGTAVAPAEKSSGVTASRPAGAVIAPAKQRRVRAIFIKIAVVVGAGAAIGAVAMLSHSSPSQPR